MHKRHSQLTGSILKSYRSQHKCVHFHSCTGRHYTLHSQYQLDPNTDMTHYTVDDMPFLQQLRTLKFMKLFANRIKSCYM